MGLARLGPRKASQRARGWPLDARRPCPCRRRFPSEVACLPPGAPCWAWPPSPWTSLAGPLTSSHPSADTASDSVLAASLAPFRAPPRAPALASLLERARRPRRSVLGPLPWLPGAFRIHSEVLVIGARAGVVRTSERVVGRPAAALGSRCRAGFYAARRRSPQEGQNHALRGGKARTWRGTVALYGKGVWGSVATGHLATSDLFFPLGF